MAGNAIDVVVRFLTDTSKVEKDVGKVQGTGDKLKGWAKGVGAAIGGVFAVKTVSDWIGAAEEADSVSAGLAQSLANAGDATGEWARHAEDLANTLQAKTGIDDEVIKKGQTILGTFHDLSGAAGQQSGAFDRATKAALDMSKTGFGDVDSASTMLGKALEDPVKGLTALGRVGIQFTDVQKEQIKGFLAVGDKAGAMNVILGNVESQVGGMAEKTATASDKMNVAWGDTQEALGKALMPILEQLAPILQKVAGFIQENASWLVPMVAGIIALNIALSLSPITLIAIAIAALIAGLVLLWANWDQVWTWIKDAIAVAVDWIVGLMSRVGEILATPFLWAWEKIQQIWDWITGLFSNIIGWLGDHWPAILAILTGPIGIAVLLISRNIDSILGFFQSIPGRIRDALATVGNIILYPFQWAGDQIKNIAEGIKGAIGGAIDWVKGAWNAFARFWNGVEVDIPGVDIGPVHIGGGTFGLPDLPLLAKGGIVTRPTLALLGEAGREAVIPLNRAGAVGTTIVVNVTTTGLGADNPAIQRSVVNALRGYVARSGPVAGIGA